MKMEKITRGQAQRFNGPDDCNFFIASDGISTYWGVGKTEAEAWNSAFEYLLGEMGVDKARVDEFLDQECWVEHVK